MCEISTQFLGFFTPAAGSRDKGGDPLDHGHPICPLS